MSINCCIKDYIVTTCDHCYYGKFLPLFLWCKNLAILNFRALWISYVVVQNLTNLFQLKKYDVVSFECKNITITSISKKEVSSLHCIFFIFLEYLEYFFVVFVKRIVEYYAEKNLIVNIQSSTFSRTIDVNIQNILIYVWRYSLISSTCKLYWCDTQLFNQLLFQSPNVYCSLQRDNEVNFYFMRYLIWIKVYITSA